MFACYVTVEVSATLISGVLFGKIFFTTHRQEKSSKVF